MLIESICRAARIAGELLLLAVLLLGLFFGMLALAALTGAL